MCLAIPVKIQSITEGVATCSVGDTDTTLRASLAMLENEPEVGQYLIVHAGFALQVLRDEDAEESLEILRDMARLMDGENPGA